MDVPTELSMWVQDRAKWEEKGQKGWTRDLFVLLLRKNPAGSKSALVPGSKAKARQSHQAEV